MFRNVLLSTMCALALVNAARSQDHDHAGEPENCNYSVLHNGPTWDSDSMIAPHGLVANAWARDGAYGGGGISTAYGLRPGGTAVAVSSVSFWFKVTHHAVPSCLPVKFESEAMLKAEVSTKIEGDADDYALATGFQAITGVALEPASLAVAATNAGAPVQQTTVGITFGTVGFTFTIPGVSVTTDTIDRDRKSVYTAGSKETEEEQITVNCWTKIKVVTSGPFGGLAIATVEHTEVTASTSSTCEIHATVGSFVHEASEG